MPVDFTCDHCDKKMRVKDELAGKRIKCPGCSTAITVPDGDEAPAPKRSAATRPDKPPPPPPAKRKPAEDEEDEKPRRPARKAREEDDDEDEASKRSSAVRDTKPSSRYKEDEEEEKPSRSRKGREEEDDEEDDRLKKKPKKQEGSSLPMIFGIGGGSIGLVLIGFAVWWFFFSGPGTKPGPVVDGDKDKNKGGAAESFDLKAWVPGNAQGFLSVRLADASKSGPAQKVLSEMKKVPGLPDPAEEMKKTFGFRPDELERVTLVVKEGQSNSVWVVAETTGPYEADLVRAKLQNTQELTHEGKKYIKGSLGRDPDNCLHFPGNRAIVFGSEAGIKAALSGLANRPAGALDEAFALLSDKRHVVGCVVPPAEAVQQLKQVMQATRRAESSCRRSMRRSGR